MVGRIRFALEGFDLPRHRSHVAFFVRPHSRMTQNFHAGYVGVDVMPACLQIGFADREFGTQDYLSLQRAPEFDEQDRRMGMAEVYVERNDQGFSGYGGMERFELFPDRIRVRFSESRAQVMAGFREMEITFELSREQLSALQAGLCRCFTGFSYYVDHVA